MSETCLQCFQRAEEQLRAGKYAEALVSYHRVVTGAPRYWRARFRIADVLLNLKAPRAAFEIYKALAWHALKAGQPLDALIAIKMATAMDPAQADTIEILAQLYSKDSDRITQVSDHGEHHALDTKTAAGAPLALAGQALVEAVARAAADTAAIAQYPDKLPSIPLFSYLDGDSFAQVLGSLQLRRFVRGQPIIQEGQPGDSFFILAEGHVAVSRNANGKTINLARLHPGAVFGEMALISRAPRTATVTAEDDCELLELKRAALENQAQELQSVMKALQAFTHERFLHNLTATSPIFKPFPRSIRAEIVKKFRDFPVDAGDELIAEGEVGQGLFLILKGNVQVTKKSDDGETIVLATLKEGDVFGEIALLQDSPTTATCTASSKGELLFLPRKEFLSTMARHPELKDELARITAERLQKTKQLMDTEELTIIEDDDLIML